jgi:hypothetical protein
MGFELRAVQDLTGGQESDDPVTWIGAVYPRIRWSPTGKILDLDLT